MIDRRFSAAAGTYDRHARPQLALARSVCEILPALRPERILELGCGTGQLTRLLVERFPAARIDAVDAAEQMVEHGRQTFARVPQIAWIRGDAQTYRASTPYPLVVSSAALHWVADLQEACDHVFHCLEPGGWFALGMMLHGTLKELRGVRRAVAPDKTPPDLLPAAETLAEYLRAAGFVIRRSQQRTEAVSYPSAAGFLRALHEQGVTGARPGSGRQPLMRGELDRLIARYQEIHHGPGGVRATYETATLLLEKPA